MYFILRDWYVVVEMMVEIVRGCFEVIIISGNVG